ncbi:hypothetical protein RHOSPDRAFT_36675 [Rhodotorula sp. JG-1b]|nr:hypothetical protein RHOSPDRAFT_36675 [Rhodotorula sp. JG-1b]
MPSDLPVAPAPWSLTGQGWIIPLHTHFSTTPIPIPPAAYAPLERGTEADQSDRFHGGVGFVMLVRYKSSDVGPYDELIYVPGLFSRRSPSQQQQPVEYFPAITRIYVSTDESVYNGRKNWGIPKHRANFDFTSDPKDPSSTLVRVSSPVPSSQPATTPFFACRLRDSALTPFCTPVSTTWLDHPLAQKLTRGYSASLLQPPLPAGDEASCAEVASSKTFLVKPISKGWSRLASIAPLPHGNGGLPAYGDGIQFPQIEPWSKRLNFRMTEFEMQFPIPLEL